MSLGPTSSSPNKCEARLTFAGAKRASRCIGGYANTALGFVLVLALAGCFGSTAPEVGSIGAVLSRDSETGRVYVHEVASSAAPGVLPGDEIVMIDGVFARDLDAEQLRKHLRGAPGSKVRITLVRSGHALRLELSRVALRNTFVPKTETVTP